METNVKYCEIRGILDSAFALKLLSFHDEKDTCINIKIYFSFLQLKNQVKRERRKYQIAKV